MKTRLRWLLSGLLGMFLLLAVTVPAAQAFDPFNTKDPNYSVCQAKNSDGQNSAVCTPHPEDPISGADKSGVLIKVTRLISLFAGVAGVIVIIIGGFEYMMSSGDSNRVNKAKNMILFALVGLIIVVFASFIIQFVIVRIVKT